MKNYNRIFFSAASALAALVSCTDLQELDPKHDDDNDKVVIEAGICDIPETRTNMGGKGTSGYPVYWSENDELALLDENAAVSKFKITTGAGTTHAGFEGDAMKIVGAFPESLVYPAAYPADGAFAKMDEDGTTIWVGSELPAMQKYKSSATSPTFADNVYPMAAASTNSLSYGFLNLTAIVQFKFHYTPKYSDDGLTVKIRQITLKGNKGEQVAGKVAMGFDSKTGTPIAGTTDAENGKGLQFSGDAVKSVIIDFSGQTGGGLTLTSPGVGQASPAVTVNIAVLPQTFDNGFTVEIQDAQTLSSMKYVSQDNIILKRTMLKPMAEVEFNKPPMEGTANAFLVTGPGEYILPAYAYGNRMDLKISKEVDPSKLEAAIYWTDIVNADGTMKEGGVSDVEYLKYDDGINYVKFKAGNEKGNVVVAVYDPETGKIYWSWHYWLTDPPREVVTGGSCASGAYQGMYPDGTPFDYNADATSGKLIIMDRNLGALSATPSDGWKTYGLYFEDGRKDPFIGGEETGTCSPSTRTSYSKDATVKSIHVYETSAFQDIDNGGVTRRTWINPIFSEWNLAEWKLKTSCLTLTQSIRNPLTFSYYSSNGQWTNCKDPDNQSWMRSDQYSSGTHGNTGLTFGGHEAYWNRTKTIMDPCPPGYSVLGERGGCYVNKDGKTAKHSDTDGYGLLTSFTYDGTTYNTWWPAAGVRTTDGKMGGMGEYGTYFFYDHISASHGGHGFTFKITSSGYSAVTTFSRDAVITNHATPIRCVRDKQFSDLDRYPIKDEAYYNSSAPTSTKSGVSSADPYVKPLRVAE